MTRLVDGLLKLLGLLTVLAAVFFLARNERVAGDGVTYLPSLLFVAAVLVGITCLSFEASRLWGLLRTALWSPAALGLRLRRLEALFSRAGELYYERGAEALGELASDSEVPAVWGVMRRRLAARIEIGDVRTMLSNQAEKIEDTMDSLISVATMLASLAPSVGVLGTVVGLIRLLSNLEDMQTLGPNMSLALVTTLCGLSFSVLVFSPLEARLASLKDLQLKAIRLTLFWLYLVENAKPTLYHQETRKSA